MEWGFPELSGQKNGWGGGGEGHVKLYPYEKGGGGGRTSFSHAQGGAQQVLG